VALVFRQIHDDPEYSADEILELIFKIPPDLDGIYDRMIRQIIKREGTSSQYNKRILLTIVNTYRPLQLSELVTLAALPNLAAYHNTIRLYSLLTIKEDNKTIYFIHQSAKDYLTKYTKLEILSEIFPHRRVEGHYTIVSQSLKTIRAKLQKNIYNLEYPGFPITKV
jgi:hypothetical protein